MKIQYMSDLHLEMNPGFRIAPEEVAAPILVLAGDIGDPASAEYASFMTDCAGKYEAVFAVLGNHEHYGKFTAETKEVARSVCDACGVRLLDRSSHVLAEGGLKIVGTTLWSRVGIRDAYDVQRFIADYRKIKDVRSVSDSNALHDEEVAWLRAEIEMAEVDGTGLVVVTHHAPSLEGTSAQRNSGSPLESAFATDLDHLVRRPCVRAWIHGHTHHSHESKKLVANQRGYGGGEITGFDAAKFVDLDPA
jgi:Icc-related predicted phosphoesterase